MELQSITGFLTSGVFGVIIGYMAKSVVDYYFSTKRLKSEKGWDLKQYKALNLLIPLSKSLNRLANRLDKIARRDNELNNPDKLEDDDSLTAGDEYLRGSLFYEFCCSCYWLERIDRDSKLAGALSYREKELRDALSLISGIPSYQQKMIAEAMVNTKPNSFGPISYWRFVKVGYTKIQNDILKNLLDVQLAAMKRPEKTSKAIDTILSVAFEIEREMDEFI